MILNLQPGLLGGTHQPGTLLYRHPDWHRRWWWREFGRVSYIGGREYHEPLLLSIDHQTPTWGKSTTTAPDGTAISTTAYKGLVPSTYKSLLYRHTREQEWEYIARRKRAHYHNAIKTAVNGLVSHATKRSAARQGDELLDAFWGGVDRKREMGIDYFVRNGLRWAQVMELMWACVDVDPAGDGKPYAYWVSPHDVFDWEVDEDGALVWLKHFVYTQRPRQWNEPIDPVYEFRIWHRDHVEIYKSTTAGQQIGEPEIREHGAGRVPFEPLYSSRDEEHSFAAGTALAADLCKAANHVFNLGSLLSEILYKQTFSWLAIPNANMDMAQVGVTTAFGYDAQQTGGAKPEYVSPDADQARVLMEAIINEISQMRQAFGVGRGKSDESKDGKSADALELEADDKRSILADVASEAEDFERRLASLAMAYRSGGAASAEKPTITYAREFDVRALQADIDEALALRKFRLSPEIDLELVQQLVRRRFSGMRPEKIAELVKSLERTRTPAPAVDGKEDGGRRAA